MNNEVFLLIALWFLINGAALALKNNVDIWKRTPLIDLPYTGWLYVIDCIAFDVALVAYALTQWGGV